MRKIGLLTALAAITMLGILRAASTAPLVYAADLQYQGAFRVPSAASGGSSFDVGGIGLTYNPANNTLMAVGHPSQQQVAEITIPTPSMSTSLGSLPVATYRQPFKDVLEGKLESTSSSTDRDLIGGLLVSGNSLIVSAYAFYDATYVQVRSHFRTGLDFNVTGDVVGPVQVGSAGAGVVGGHMASLPPEWQSALGGTAVTGQCCIPILARTSSGPAISAFTPSQISSSTVPASALLGYDLVHPPDDDIFKKADLIRGVVVPPGTRSILFFGRHGVGAECYGDGSPCGDPTDPYKGYHAYPYAQQVWAYDLDDLQAVKNGQKSAWEPRPYAMWTLNLPFSSDDKWIQGAAFDPATSRIFIAAKSASDGYSHPIIHVFTVTTGGSSGAPPAPAPPSNVRIIS